MSTPPQPTRTFTGAVQISESFVPAVPGTPSRVRIRLDGDTGDIALGGNGVDGDIALKKATGQETIRLNGEGSDISLKGATGQETIRLNGAGGNTLLGGNGFDGAVTLKNAAGQDMVRLHGGGGAAWFARNVAIGQSPPTGAAGLQVSGPGDATVDVASTHARGSRLRLMAVVSNNKTESQLQFRDQLTLVAPLGSEGGTAVLTVLKGGDVFVHRPDGSRSIHLDGEAGDIKLLGADCAEEFDVEAAQAIEPGTVMVMGDDDRLHPCAGAYNKKVAGVISGAGDTSPGITLGRRPTPGHRAPIALVGRVWCKVDARCAPVEVGDLLTTSPTPGHAMKAEDPFQAFGAVIGKALRRLESGQGLIPILVALQ